jgi:hypothetical protein
MGWVVIGMAEIERNERRARVTHDKAGSRILMGDWAALRT